MKYIDWGLLVSHQYASFNSFSEISSELSLSNWDLSCLPLTKYEIAESSRSSLLAFSFTNLVKCFKHNLSFVSSIIIWMIRSPALGFHGYELIELNCFILNFVFISCTCATSVVLVLLS